ENPVEARYLWLASALQTIGDVPEAAFVQELATKNGAQQFQVRISRIFAPKGEERGAAAILESITDQQLPNARRDSGHPELSPSYLVDALTGLHNRRGFSALATQLMKLADQMKRHLAFLVCSVEGVAQAGNANATQTDDQVLLAVAAILRDTFRASDIIARVGKEEFAVLAVGSFNGGAEELAGRLQSAVEKQRSLGKFDHQLLISMGLIPYDPLYPRDIDDLLTRIPGDV
ncbi:MAG TPA: GGDEF domain-containing protein, partial [Chloroflexota bacterium]|nr:GGDEF domain-containing protein [Chloroflexota bacterium]